uniref:Olfactory receptor n=1 Tax=Pyxicephalus adspersus TaxID=30357 RepID=A0AAV2ZY33_PYXAD|nr:TPA: hypothetical protein GDO54_014833 [Pyxicephalus adspersus]
MGREVPRTNITDFILLGFSDLSFPAQASLFIFFLCAYVVTLLGNGLILLMVTIDSLLHTPMYFFLRNLSFLEICFTAVIVPKAMQNFSVKCVTSFIGCATQMYIFLAIGVCECIFLMVMAIDRYMAICQPLRYKSVMTRLLCYQLTVVCWIIGLLLSLGQTIYVFSLPYCGSNSIAHFFCDIPPLLNIACGNIFNNKLSVIIACMCGAVVPFILILCSYVNILSSILLINSSQGRHKALSTCGSHLVSVLLFYGTAMLTYLRLGTEASGDKDWVITLFYYIAVPALNPLIYSLRNQDMKTALRKLPSRILDDVVEYW